MNIVFDIDDTITKETEFMLKNAPKYLKNKYGINACIKNPNGYDVSEVFGLREILEQKNFNGDIELELQKINNSFWNKYFIKYMFYPLKEDSKKIIDSLKKQGYKINFVSLRGKKGNDKENFKKKLIRTKVVPFLTMLQLKLNRIKYDKLIMVEKNEDKCKIAKELNASIIFDDNVDVMESVNNIIPICVETPHNILVEFKNKNVIKLPFKFESVNKIIKDYEEKKIIERPRIRKIKKLKLYKRLLTETTYVIVRNFSKNKVIRDLKPLIIGEENLPKLKGPNVYVSNHRNIKDPIITIACLKDPTHFAALKRMFEYNENMFGKVGKNIGTYATTLLVKSMGCLPIARPTDENYKKINVLTFRKIKEYIDNNSAIAIYPEGTINRKPEENGNILPLKSDQIFRLAKNSNAIIRPIAIVWVPKSIKIQNRVLIAFLQPIYSKDLSVDDISKCWNNSVNDAIDSMNKIINELEKISNINDESSEKIKRLVNEIKTL